MKKVYFDNAATTKLDPRVLEKMLPYLKEDFGNPSSIHSFGRKARVAIEEARENIAGFLNADASEIYFVSNGTEANNFSLFGIAKTEFQESGKKKVITTNAEHHSVLESCEKLRDEGFDVDFAKVDGEGKINPQTISDSLDGNVSLVSVLHINNETGVVNPIKEISELKENSAFYFHTDAVQSFGKIRLDVKELGVDCLTFSGHKIHGPKGIGGVFAKSGTPLSPLIYGGSQERNRRGGTENVAAIVGMSEAVKIAQSEMDDNYKIVTSIFNEFIEGIKALNLEGLSVNITENQSPYVLSLTFNPEYFKSDSEAMLMYLDINGVAASNGAACASGTIKPSHVIAAMGKSEEEANGTIRFSFSHENTTEEVHYAIDVLKKMAHNFRK